MESEVKKPYKTPELTVYGNVEDLTQQNGSSAVDVPFGTPVPPGNVIGDPPGS